jgi:mRNA interferase RelE/StbE
MKYIISKRFEKDVNKISDRKILEKIKRCIEEISSCTALSEIQNSEPLKGFPGYYRIKFD